MITFLLGLLISVYGFSQVDGFAAEKTQLADHYVLVTITGPVENYATYICKGDTNNINKAVFADQDLNINQNDRDTFDDNIDLGLLPSDIFYFGDQYHENMIVYGGHKLRILDGDNHDSIIADFDIDTKISTHNMTFMPVSPHRVQIIKNTRHDNGQERSFIICAGEGGGLTVVESLPDSFQVFQTFADDEEGRLLSSSVHGYCDTSFYWVLNYWDGKCKVKKYAWDNNNDEYFLDKKNELVLNNDEIIFFQTRMTPGPLRLALLGEVLVIDPVTLEEDQHYDNLLVDNIQNNYAHIKGQHKIFSFDGGGGVVLDNINMITMATSGCYDWENDRAYFTGYCNKLEPDFKLVNYNLNDPNFPFRYFTLDGAMDVKSNTTIDTVNDSKVVAVGNNIIRGFDYIGDTNCVNDLACHYGYRIAFDQVLPGYRIGIAIACLNDGLLVQRDGYSCVESMEAKIVETGISSSITCYDDEDKKAYFFYNGEGGSNMFAVYNEASDTTGFILIDSLNPRSLSAIDCIYNKKSQMILTSMQNHCDDSIYIGNIINDSLNLLKQRYLDCSPFINYDQYIYCYLKGADLNHYIYRFWQENSQFNESHIQISYPVKAVDINKETGKIYCMGSDDGVVVEVDKDLATSQNHSIIGNNPVDISYIASLNKIYIVQEEENKDRIEVYNTNFNHLSDIDLNDNPKNIEYNPYQKEAYVMSDYDEGTKKGFTKITVIDCTLDHVIKEKLIRRSDGYIYDTINDQLYMHTNFPAPNDNGELEYNIKALNNFDDAFSNKINANLFTYSDIYLNKKRSVPSKPSYNYEDNYIYVGNYGSATASKIKAFDESLTFRPGWKWLSFPRMERYLNETFDAITLLRRIEPWDPQSLFMEYHPANDWKTITYDPLQGWDGLLTTLKSTQGYKLQYLKSGTLSCSLRMEGAKEDYDTKTDLVTGENWVGYFIDKPLYPEDCLPAGLWNSLVQIKTQYWTMTRMTVNPPIWIHDNKVTPFRYGDLVILKTNHPYPDFQWQNPAKNEEDKEIPVTSYYSFEEQSDYLPFYVETDSVSDIQEIAVLADGEVKGAAVREPGDTIVEVNGYLQGVAPGAVIEFETYNGYKSEPVEKGNYVVIDHQRKIREKRNIYAGEKAMYYHVSLRSNEVYELPPEIGLATCQPNPFGMNTTFTFRINEKSNISIRIYDLQGIPVKTLINGIYPEGYYSLTWNGDNDTGSRIAPGVYFYRVSIGNKAVQTDKIVMIK